MTLPGSGLVEYCGCFKKSCVTLLILLSALCIHPGEAASLPAASETRLAAGPAPPAATEPRPSTPAVQPAQGKDPSESRPAGQPVEGSGVPAVVRHISLVSLDKTGSRLILSLTRPVSHYIFMLAQPDRIVIDLDNTRGDIPINGKPLTNGLIQMVRSGIHEDGRLRIVLDLRAPAYAGSVQQGPDENGDYRLLINVHPVTFTKDQPRQTAAQSIPPRSSRTPSVAAPDMIELDLSYANAPLGTIDAVEYPEGYMLPLSQLFQILGLPIQVDPDRGLAEGWFINKNHLFVLDTTRGVTIVDGEQGTFRKGLSQIRDKDIFVDVSLLNRLLPVQLELDPSALTLSLKVDADLPEDQRRAISGQWLSLNGNGTAAVPPGVAPALIQQGPSAPGGQTPVPQTAPPAGNEAPTAEGKTGSAAKPIGQVTDDDLIILQPVIDGVPVKDYIQAYHVGRTYLLPLQAMSDILQFPITVDIDEGKASGWFISEDRTFSFDLNRHQVNVGGKTRSFPRDRVYATDSDFYIDSRLMSKWFPLDFAVDLRKLVLKISPREMLPFQIREKRLKDWEMLQNRRRAGESLDIVKTPYELASLPFFDLNASQNYVNQGQDRFTTNYSLLASGDLGYLGSNLFAAGGSTGHVVDTARLSAGRRSAAANLLGPLHASAYSMGDITSITLPLVGQPSLGRGFAVTNRPLFLANAFDSTNFIGDVQPGWDVELYRNGALIGLQTVGANGRYEFLNVPILYGNNTFQLIFNGPQGQVHEEIRRFNIDSSILRKGDMNYEFSMDQKAAPLIDVGGNNAVPYSNNLRMGSQVEYGLNNSLTGTVGLMMTPLADYEQHRYFTTGLRKSFRGFLGSLDAAYDQSSGGWAAKLAGFGSIRRVYIKGEYSRYDRFVSEEITDLNNLLSSTAELNLNSTFSVRSFDNINVNLNVKRDEFAAGQGRTIISNILSKSLLGFRLTSFLEYTSYQSRDTSRGELSLRSHFLDALVRADLMYSITPQLKSDRFQLSLQKMIWPHTIALLDVTKYMSNGGVTSVSGSLNWDVHDYTLSVYSSYDSQNRLMLRANLNMSFGRIPNSNRWLVSGRNMAAGGIVATRAYLDENRNNEYDRGEEIISNSRFKINRNAVTAKDGVAVAASLPVDRYASVRIDPAGLEDPLWLPTVKGYRFLPRPGVVTTVDFPVVEASEIDGVVKLIDEHGYGRPIARVGLELIDVDKNTVVQKVRSEYDGYYIFEKVLPGKYRIRVRDLDLKRLNVRQEEAMALDIANRSDTYSGRDIRLRKNGAPIEISHRD